MRATGPLEQRGGPWSRPAVTSPPWAGGSGLPWEERELPLQGPGGSVFCVLFLFCFEGSISPLALRLDARMQALFASLNMVLGDTVNMVKVLGDTGTPSAPDSSPLG